MNNKKIFTLCIIHQRPKILLGMKKRGFGEGKWNGFGGKVKPGERIIDAAKREVREESSLDVKDMKKFGIIEFEFQGNSEILLVHLFKTNKFQGNPVETEEMRPRWFPVDKIPFQKMWPDDRYWMPLLLAEKKFRGKFLFEGFDKIIDYEIKEI